MYKLALLGVELCCEIPRITEQQHKLLANMSLVMYRCQRFVEAEEFACNAISARPNYVKVKLLNVQGLAVTFNCHFKHHSYIQGCF